MEKFESNNNYESESIDSVIKDYKKELDDHEKDLGFNKESLSEPDDEVQEILDSISENMGGSHSIQIPKTKKIEIGGEVRRGPKITYDEKRDGSYEFHVSFYTGVGKDKSVNYCLKYDADDDAFYFMDTRRKSKRQGSGFEEIEYDDAINILDDIDTMARKLKNFRGSNGGLHYKG